MNVIIKPEGYLIPKEASDVHGITTGDALEFGIPKNIAFKMFLELFSKADYLVAHNIEFDLRMLCRYARDPKKNVFTDKMTRHFCTMRAMTDICQLPLTEKQEAAKKKGLATNWAPPGGWPTYKAPTLSECWWHLYTQELDGAHDAMVDVEACREVFMHLKNEGRLV